MVCVITPGFGAQSKGYHRRSFRFHRHMAVPFQHATADVSAMRPMVGGRSRLPTNVRLSPTSAHVSLIYQTQSTDPAAIAASILLLIATAALAVILPAHRAAAVDPMEVLRKE